VPGLYLAIIVGGIVGMLLIDLRERLAIRVQPRATLLTIAVSVAFYSTWDAAGIFMGIFFEGNNNWLLGWFLAPEYPIEEFFFLTLLAYTTLVIYRWIEKKVKR
jgi:lycopene cyclase domain-containing protein